jgi:hypothetical protein
MAFTGFRAPALPLPPNDYNRQQFDELFRALRIYFNLLDSLTPQQAQSYRADNFFGGFFVGGVTAAITAAGTTQATATEITTASNNVTVVRCCRKRGKTPNSPARGAGFGAKLRCRRLPKHLPCHWSPDQRSWG